MIGVAKQIDELGASDESFLRDHCEGYDDWIGQVRGTTWEEIVAKSGVSQEEIEDIARTYSASKNAVFSWTMGVTHHAHGVQNVQAIANLALMRGMVGRPNAGLLPIRGHSNVQGVGSMGVTPKLKDAIFTNLQELYGVQLPTQPGLDTLACMESAYDESLEFGFCLGGNLYGSNPDASFAEASLSKLKSLVYVNTTLNTGHAYGLADETIILPVLARDEEPQPTTQESMFNYVRLSDGGPARHEGPRSEVEVIASIAGGGCWGDDGPVNWKAMEDTGEIRSAIAQVVPGFEKLRDIAETKSEFQIGGRTFHDPKFPTASGRAILHSHEIPELQGGGDMLRVMTVRSEGQFNTVVYEEEDLYRGQERRDVILMHPDDIQRLGLTNDQPVTVRNDVGSLAKHLGPQLSQHPSWERPDVLSRGECVGLTASRRAIEDASFQRRPG